MPGSGRLSSIRIRPGVFSKCSRAVRVAAVSSSQPSPRRRRCTGLPEAGPCARARTSTSNPGSLTISAFSSSRTVLPSYSSAMSSFSKPRYLLSSPPNQPSNGSLSVGRSSQGMISNWTWPMVSGGSCAPELSVFRPPSPAKEKTLITAWCCRMMSSAARTISSFSRSEMLPRARTYAVACSGSESTKNSTPRLFSPKVLNTVMMENATTAMVTMGITGLPAMNLITWPKGV
mmetsp:Transcript_3755/g.4888  ORF Transcript_3755/g.4888 Transcript_3755/m.4888 type:complete len:232 (-) Transcript_3755:25-720(-)